MAKKVDARKKLECKSCGRLFVALLTHLNQSVCLKQYSNEEIEAIKAEKQKERDAYQKEYNKNYCSQNKEEINEKRKQRRNDNRDATNEKKRIYRAKKIMDRTSKDRLLAFKKEIVDGPNFTCCSCRRRLFKKQVQILDTTKISNLKAKLDKKFLRRLGLGPLGRTQSRNQLIFCYNCIRLIKVGKLPKIHYSNGLWLDKVPDELMLKDLEQQLIARSLIFMKVKKLPTTRMKSMLDKVISVPLEQEDVSKTMSSLPRHPDDSKIVAVQLKRKIRMKNSHLEEYIRPAKCIKAVEKLKELGNPFYKDVTVNKQFLQKEEVCCNHNIDHL